MRHPLPIGNKYGRLLCTGYSGTRYKSERLFLCQCDCGKTTIVRGACLRSGDTKSCGCWQVESSRARHTKHGASSLHQKSVEYKTWTWMKARCLCKTNKKYPSYGGAGIGIHPAWVNDFQSFLDHVGKRPDGKYSIDRIDNTKGYEPGNVRWATPEQQMANRSNTVTVDGVRLTEIAASTGVSYSTLYARIWRAKCRAQTR